MKVLNENVVQIADWIVVNEDSDLCRYWCDGGTVTDILLTWHAMTDMMHADYS